MKKYLFAIAVAASLLAACGPTHVVVESAPPPPPPPPPAEAPYQAFYDQLSPYGHWIDYPGMGYVFMPDVGPDFKPYSTNGHWVYTNEGWVWASDYNWGWATFHYGRWFYEDGYGWMWIPGHEWAPAWVVWRRSPEYYGWAPMGPGVSVNVSVGGGYNPPAHYWSFVPHQYITHPHVNNYYVNESRNVTIINNTTIINNHVTNNNTTINNNVTNIKVNNHNNYAGGPDLHEVETATGAPVHPVALRESNKPAEQMQNGQMAVYRPRANGSISTPKPAPAKIETLTQIKPVNTMRYSNSNTPVINNNNSNNQQEVLNNANNNRKINSEKPPVNNNQVLNSNQPAVINHPVNSVHADNNSPFKGNQPPANSPVVQPVPSSARKQFIKTNDAAKMSPAPVNMPSNNNRNFNRPAPQQNTAKQPMSPKNKPADKPNDKPRPKPERRKDEKNN